MGKILTNHLGYDQIGSKKAVFQADEASNAGDFFLIDYRTGEEVYRASARKEGSVANWKTGFYWTLIFDDFEEEGKFFIELDTDEGRLKSYPFDIKENLLATRTISSVGYYFKAQRSSGEWLAEDKDLPFRGEREGRHDASGGWYDASGDYGIHLSHLSHGSYFNPQQAAFSGYVFFRAHELLEESGKEVYTMVKRRMLDEAMFGADFIMRRRAPSGSFFRSVARGHALESVSGTRGIGFEYKGSSRQFGEAVTANEEVITDESYETSFRSGGGYAIATLAAAGRYYYPSDYSQEEYIKAAKESYNYLEKNNERYTNDDKWNLLDEYCALDALVELYKTTREYDYLYKARRMSESMLDKLVKVDDDMAYFSVDGSDRPFYHASDAGLPVVSLLNYLNIEIDETKKEKVLDACVRVMRYSLFLTDEDVNPFGYGKYIYKNPEGKMRKAFFFAHTSEVAPWWQGENARLGSLACASRYLSYYVEDEDFKARLESYSDDQINWILGLNPFDSCMMEGYGRNNIHYFFGKRKDFIACPGGIVNGITSGLNDEDGIDYIMEPTDEVSDNWRWAEQWLPHASWYLYAISMKKR